MTTGDLIEALSTFSPSTPLLDKSKRAIWFVNLTNTPEGLILKLTPRT